MSVSQERLNNRFALKVWLDQIEGEQIYQVLDANSVNNRFLMSPNEDLFDCPSENSEDLENCFISICCFNCWSDDCWFISDVMSESNQIGTMVLPCYFKSVLWNA